MDEHSLGRVRCVSPICVCVCVCVCLCMFMCAFVYVCTGVDWHFHSMLMSVYASLCMHVCACVCASLCMHVCVLVRVPVRVCLCLCLCLCTFVHACVCVLVRVRVCLCCLFLYVVWFVCRWSFTLSPPFLTEPIRAGRELHTTTIRNEHAYYCCIAQLFAYHSLPLPRQPPLYIIGDSHSLTTGWQSVRWGAEQQQHLVHMLLVTGLKVRVFLFACVCLFVRVIVHVSACACACARACF